MRYLLQPNCQLLSRRHLQLERHVQLQRRLFRPELPVYLVRHVSAAFNVQFSKRELRLRHVLLRSRVRHVLQRHADLWSARRVRREWRVRVHEWLVRRQVRSLLRLGELQRQRRV